MPKLTEREFNRIEEELTSNIDEYYRVISAVQDPVRIDRFTKKIEEEISILINNDLSETDIEDWADFIDENIERILDVDSFPKVQGLEEFKNILYDKSREIILSDIHFREPHYIRQDILGDEFRKRNPDLYPNEKSINPDVLEKYYARNLDFQSLRDNIDSFKGIKVSHAFKSDNVLNKFAKFLGNDFEEIVVRYGGVLDVLAETNYFIIDINTKNIPENLSKDEKIKYIKKLSIQYADVIDLENESIETIKEFLDFVDIDDLALDKNIKAFIKKFGIDNISKLNDYMGDFLLQKSFKSINTNLKYLVNTFDMRIVLDDSEADNIQKEYKQLKDLMVGIIIDLRTSGKKDLDLSTAGEEFKKEYPELFLDEPSIPDDIRKKFYSGTLKPGDIKNNPEIIPILKNKMLEGAFTGEYIEPLRDDFTYMGHQYRHHILMDEFLVGILGNEDFLKLCTIYGDYLSWKLEINKKLGEIYVSGEIIKDISEFTDLLDEFIYEEITTGTSYGTDLPDSFKNKHKELFLSPDAPQELQRKYYEGTLLFEDILNNPEYEKYLDGKFLFQAFKKTFFVSRMRKTKDNNDDLIRLIKEYGSYLNRVNNYAEYDSLESKRKYINEEIYRSIIMFGDKYDENAPESFKQAYPELFLDENAPKELVQIFYNGNRRKNNQPVMEFKDFKNHPEWKNYLKEKNLIAAFSATYYLFFGKVGNETAIEMGMKFPQQVEKMCDLGECDSLLNWYKATKGKWLPSHVVMLNFPENEIDDFLRQSKKWSRIMQNAKEFNDDEKAGLLKAAYAFGVFKNNDEGLNKILELFGSKNGKEPIISKEMAHKLFGSFAMEYNPEFYKFFINKLDEILSDSEYIENISAIQRAFKEISTVNAGRKIDLNVAMNYISNVNYLNVSIGNEELAKQVKIASYSQDDFLALQKIYNIGEMREYSSIPRVEGLYQGKLNEYRYEILRLDDPLALTVGVLTNCCQKIYDAAESSMKHSMISNDGRVFVVKDGENRIVAQSWVWRNQDVICFDNIEIPARVERKYSDIEDEYTTLTREVLEVYKMAAKDFRKIDEAIEVTVGMGYNDIARAIRTDSEMEKETSTEEPTKFKSGDKIIAPYSDAEIQYILEKGNTQLDEETEKSNIYEDDIPIYDSSNINETLIYMIRRMDSSGRNILSDLEIEGNFSPQDFIGELKYNYKIGEDSDLKILATNRISMICIISKDGKYQLCDLFYAPFDENYPYKKEEYENHLIHQIARSIKQTGLAKENIDEKNLDDDQIKLLDNAFSMIEKEENDLNER